MTVDGKIRIMRVVSAALAFLAFSLFIYSLQAGGLTSAWRSSCAALGGACAVLATNLTRRARALRSGGGTRS